MTQPLSFRRRFIMFICMVALVIPMISVSPAGAAFMPCGVGGMKHFKTKKKKHMTVYIYSVGTTDGDVIYCTIAYKTTKKKKKDKIKITYNNRGFEQTTSSKGKYVSAKYTVFEGRCVTVKVKRTGKGVKSSYSKQLCA